ncbi:MAG: AMP-binding protein [Pseudomonadota bacterium]
MNLHFATCWEAIAQEYPARVVSICDGDMRTWGDFERRAACLASLLKSHGLGQDTKGAIYLHNSHEYLEAQFAIFKIGGCPINVNYRYKSDELEYLLENSDAEVVFFQSCYAMRIWEIKDKLPKVKLFVQIDDGTEAMMDFAQDYERAIREHEPLAPRSLDSETVYMLYTGGTTGLPKGVMYPVGSFAGFLTQMGAVGAGLEPPLDLHTYREYLAKIEYPPISLVGCPMMHGTGMWLGCFVPMMMGGTVVSTSKLGLDPHRLWSLVEQHRVSDIVIVGDAFARPMLAALNEAKARKTPYDLRAVKQISSSGVMWSEETKRGLLEHHNFVLNDIMGSTEGGMGSAQSSRESGPETAKFNLNDGVVVIADDGTFVAPGSKVIGRIATSNLVPLGYYKDPEKSAATFQDIDGVRYSFPGDYATVEPDGSITLLGRGSVCINTGGEKVFPEEVEEAVKRHRDVLDCLVVGLPDERFGEQVVAICNLYGMDPEDPDSYVPVDSAVIDELIEHCAGELAGYKVPRQMIVTPMVKRAPNGKADYKWAKTFAGQKLGV